MFAKRGLDEGDELASVFGGAKRQRPATDQLLPLGNVPLAGANPFACVQMPMSNHWLTGQQQPTLTSPAEVMMQLGMPAQPAVAQQPPAVPINVQGRTCPPSFAHRFCRNGCLLLPRPDDSAMQL